MSPPKEAQINLLHHRVLSCRTGLQRLAEAAYSDDTSPENVVPACQRLLKSYVEALEVARFAPDAFVLPTGDEVRICGEKGCDAHSAVLALTGRTLASVAMVVCSPPDEKGCVRFDDDAQEKLSSRIIEIMMPRVQALFPDLSEDRKFSITP